MGAIIPQVVTSDRATGAQVIDGSLKFVRGSTTNLTRTPSSGGNRKTWTWSAWIKRHTFGTFQGIFSAGNTSGDTDFLLVFTDADKIRIGTGGADYASSTAVFRDTGWYHILAKFDTTQSSGRVKIYVNGEEIISNDSWSQNTDYSVNEASQIHKIGIYSYTSGNEADYSMSNAYLIDGQALGPEYFGYTDGLTNTWKPKKYTGTFGTNGFWLPMDGSAPIGQDQSGQGNDWTPVNFGGSVSLDNPIVSGARPVLNTTQGGAQAGVGVFGSKQNVGYAVTVYNDGGGNKYYIDGVKTASITGLIRGATYTFDTSDSTVSSHPFRLSATSNGSHGGGSEYTNGVAAITGAATTITVPHDAPETLYYYCTVHSGMGNDSSISGITTNEKLADQYASHCVLAVPFISGVSDDVSPSIACTSTKKSLTKQGDPTSTTTSSNFYRSSTDFDGAGDYYTSGSESDFAFGTGDFTVEFWFDSDDLGGSNQEGFLQISDTSGGLKTGYANGFAIYESATAGGVLLAGLTGTIPAVFKPGVWNHVALVREGTSVRLYANGVLKDTQTSSKNISGTYLALGGYYSTSYVYNGRMQDFRIYKGVAKYNGNFVVPSTSPAILPDTPSGVSGGSKLTKITDGAVAFDGTNDSLSVADHADFTFGSGDFTMEAFVYNKSSGYRSIVMKYGGNPASSSWFWSMYNGQNQFYYYSGGNEPAVTSGQTHYNKWVHCAVSREGNTIRLFDNGELTGTLDVSSYDTMNDSTVPLDIGADYADNYDMDGFISNVRVIKGTALYTSNFTPPSAPLTNVTNTKLLCCQSNTQPGAAVTSPNMGGVNNGTNWSHFLTTNAGDNFDGSGPKYYAFDGNGSNKAYTGNNSNGTTQGTSFLQVNFPSPISGALRVKCDNGNTVRNVTSGDTLLATQSSGSDNQFVDCGNVSNLSKLRVLMSGGSRPAISVVELDGTTLVDPASPIGDVVATNFNPFITDINTVRGQETGYATFNPLIAPSGGDSQGSGGSFSDGNLTIKSGGTTGNYLLASCSPSIPLTGKYYFEFTTISAINTDNNTIGIYNPESPVYASGDYARINPSFSGSFTTTKKRSGTATNLAGSAGDFSGGDIVNIAIDSDNRSIWFGKNGVYYEGNPSSGTGASYTNLTAGVEYVVRSFVYNSGSTQAEGRINFGQKPFMFSPPDGFQPLNTANTRPVNVISRPDQYVGIVTYTGNGSTNRPMKIGFQPDLVWLKSRESSFSNYLGDSVRGKTKLLQSNSTAIEITSTTGITDFNSDGFTLGNGSETNLNGDDMVAWTWKAGGNKNTFNVDDVGYASASDVNMNVGGQNSNAYNTSAIWSGMMSGPSNSGVYTNLFDGTDGPSGGYEQPTDGNTLTFTPTGGITASTSIEIYVYQSSGTYAGSADITVNGTSIKTTAVQSALGTGAAGGYVNTGTKSLTTLTWSNPSGSNNDYRLMAIRVDGKMLVDSNQTPPNAPSTAATGCSVGTKQSFSIIKATLGTASGNITIPHGLQKTPDFIIAKSLTNTYNWDIYHKDATPNGQNRLIFTTSAVDTNDPWGNIAPTSSVFTFNAGFYADASDSVIFYSWADVLGLQKFGSCNGSGASATPDFVELGFKPSMVWVKRTDSTGNWTIWDSTRNTFNPSQKQLFTNSTAKESDSSADAIDILSNGFAIRSSSSFTQTGSQTYIYCAWAESPSIDLFGGGANAR